MRNHLFNHRCVNCGSTYLSPDKERIFCASDCEANFKMKKRANTIQKLSEEERREKNKASLEKFNERKKLAKKDLPKKEKEYRYLKAIMYADTFKPYVPKGLKV